MPVGILLHKETPNVQRLLSLLKGLDVVLFSDFCEVERRNSLVIAGFQHFDNFSVHQLNRTLLIGDEQSAHELKDGAWFEKGLCDAFILPINSVLFLAKVEHLSRQALELYVVTTAMKIQELYSGSISPKEVGILHAFLRNGAAGVSRSQLVDGIWPGLSVHSKTLDTHLFNLRSKLETCGVHIVWHRLDQVWRLHSRNVKINLE